MIRGEYSAGGGLDDSDIIGSIENCIAVNVAKLTPQVMRKDARGMTIKDDYLARLLSLRWAPELSAYDALYKMAATLVRKSNAFAAVMYNEDFTKVKQIVPLTVSSFRIYEDDDGNILSPANCKLAISRCFFPMQRPGPVLPAPLHRPSPAPCRAGNPADSLDQNLRRRLEPARRAVRPEAEPGGLRPPKPPLGGGLLCGPPAAFHPIFP